MFETIFLRLYGYNLGRKSRNSAKEACDDAIRQLGIFTALPIVLVEAGVGLFVPQLPRMIQARDPRLFLGAMACLVPGALWANRKFSPYAQRSAEALRYS